MGKKPKVLIPTLKLLRHILFCSFLFLAFQKVFATPTLNRGASQGRPLRGIYWWCSWAWDNLSMETVVLVSSCNGNQNQRTSLECWRKWLRVPRGYVSTLRRWVARGRTHVPCGFLRTRNTRSGGGGEPHSEHVVRGGYRPPMPPNAA